MSQTWDSICRILIFMMVKRGVCDIMANNHLIKIYFQCEISNRDSMWERFYDILLDEKKVIVDKIVELF